MSLQYLKSARGNINHFRLFFFLYSCMLIIATVQCLLNEYIHFFPLLDCFILENSVLWKEKQMKVGIILHISAIVGKVFGCCQFNVTLALGWYYMNRNSLYVVRVRVLVRIWRKLMACTLIVMEDLQIIKVILTLSSSNPTTGYPCT